MFDSVYRLKVNCFVSTGDSTTLQQRLKTCRRIENKLPIRDSAHN